jgi:hypothetical protein
LQREVGRDFALDLSHYHHIQQNIGTHIMADAKVLSGAGLRGQVAGKTALSTVGKEAAGLT